MKKRIAVFLIALLLFSVIMTYLLTIFFKKANEFVKADKQKYTSEIGKKIVLEKDTLTIVDYSTLNETFTLSNGKTISYTFIKNGK